MNKWESRQKQLLDLKCYLQTVDTEVTMILQSLQWDRRSLLEGTTKVTCQYDTNHKMPSETLSVHEDNCRLRKLGYCAEDAMLPEPLNENAISFVKFNMTDIQQIINAAAQKDPLFKRGPGCIDPKPLTLERIQAAYTADERRAIYDAVVKAAPSCSDLSELALPSTNEKNQKGDSAKTRLEILAELRDMKRRRTKYRVAAKTQKYSDVLRDVIKTQMEVYSEVNAEEVSTTSHIVNSKRLNNAKDDNNLLKSEPKRNLKETKIDDTYTREKHKKYHTGSSREREEKRSNSESRKRHDYENKYRDNKERERRYPTEKDKYYAGRDRKKSSHERAYEKKYDRSHSSHGQMNSSRDRSRDERSHRNRGHKTKYVKEEDEGYKYKESRPEKEEKYKRYYDVRIKEE